MSRDVPQFRNISIPVAGSDVHIWNASTGAWSTDPAAFYLGVNASNQEQWVYLLFRLPLIVTPANARVLGGTVTLVNMTSTVGGKTLSTEVCGVLDGDPDSLNWAIADPTGWGVDTCTENSNVESLVRGNPEIPLPIHFHPQVETWMMTHTATPPTTPLGICLYGTHEAGTPDRFRFYGTSGVSEERKPHLTLYMDQPYTIVGGGGETYAPTKEGISRPKWSRPYHTRSGVSREILTCRV